MALLIDDTNGNLNIDFLVGVVIFIGAFLYLINMIPGIFLPYQTNSVDLGSVVYRTSCLLAEDPGWWINNGLGENGTDWEYESVSDLARVGLAVDKTDPDVLSQDKIYQMKALPYTLSRDDLGLNNTMTYNYSLVIRKLLPDDTTEELLNISQPSYASNVESIDRMVLIREGEGLYYDNHSFIYGGQLVNAAGATNLTVGRSPSFDLTNITVRLTDFVPVDGTFCGFDISYYVGPYYNSSALVTAIGGSEYYLYKNGNYMDTADLEVEPFNIGDKLDIVLNMRTIGSKYTTQGLNVSRIMLASTVVNGMTLAPFPDVSDYETLEDYNVTNPNYRYFDTRGIMTLQVWQV